MYCIYSDYAILLTIQNRDILDSQNITNFLSNKK